MIPPASGWTSPSRAPAARDWSSYSRCHIYARRQTPGSQVTEKAPLWASRAALTDLGYQVYHQPELCQHPPGGSTDFKGLKISILALCDTIAHIYPSASFFKGPNLRQLQRLLSPFLSEIRIKMAWSPSQGHTVERQTQASGASLTVLQAGSATHSLLSDTPANTTCEHRGRSHRRTGRPFTTEAVTAAADPTVGRQA